MKSTRTMLVFIIAAGAVLVLLIAVSKDNLPFQPKSREVLIVNPNGVGRNQSMTFQPQTVTVVIGVNNTVTWVNEDGTPHTSRSDLPGFDSGVYGPNERFTHIFSRGGVFPYHCDLHPWMKGTVIVKEPL